MTSISSNDWHALIVIDSQKTLRVILVVWALTALLTVHVYSPASSLLAWLMSREPALIVMRLSEDRTAPFLPQTTLTSEPADQLHLRDTFPPSSGRDGRDKLTPFTASEEGKTRQRNCSLLTLLLCWGQPIFLLLETLAKLFFLWIIDI